jgi:nucleoside-diphosphate-sugar epimerase
MKKILITGGAGYIGSVLTRKILTLGYEIVVFDACFYTDMGLRAIRDPSLKIVRGDLRNTSLLRESLTDIDCVIHLAAIANDPSAELDVELTRQVNLESYCVLLAEAANAGVQRFINMSSISVYGINFNGQATEDDSLNPLTEYAACKAKSEAIVQQHNSNQFTTVSLRCGTVCGWSPRMRFDLCANTLAAYAIVNRNLVVWGGAQRRPQVHIDDITDLITRLLTVSSDKIGGRIFNAAGYNVTVSEVAEIIKEEMQGELEITSVPARSDERTYQVSSEKIIRELGFMMTRTVRDAVADIKKAYQDGFWRDPYDSLYHNVKRMKSMEHSIL